MQYKLGSICARNSSSIYVDKSHSVFTIKTDTLVQISRVRSGTVSLDHTVHCTSGSICAVRRVLRARTSQHCFGFDLWCIGLLELCSLFWDRSG